MLKKIFFCFVCFAFLFQSVEAFATANVPYAYDANGNLTQGDGKFFEYNDANKLVRVRLGDDSGPVIAEFFYDHSGQRIKKIENGVVTYYVGKHFDKVVKGDSPGETIYYFAGVHRVSKKDQDGNHTYFHADHLRSSNVVTDSSGSVMERIKHYPYGDIRAGGSERYTFTGKEKDSSTDFHYFEARYYNYVCRIFSQADIVVPNHYDPQSFNRYAYVRSNPLKFYDPSGHSWLEETWGDLKEMVASQRQSAKHASFLANYSKRRPLTHKLYDHSLQDSPDDLMPDSKLSQQLSRKILGSQEFREYTRNYIKSQIHQAKKDGRSYFEIELFNEESVVFENGDLATAVHGTKQTRIYGKMDKNGVWSITVNIYDVYDFDYDSSQSETSAGNIGYRQQEAGILNNYDLHVTVSYNWYENRHEGITY
jgi:RHS repeat-associated protein